ncbi:MAG: cobalamin-dependent protein [Candidatus Eremiobacteraeota bacterium]|nr:cobalamin-dependent protein [Candidatus Eremiobacteraeota bacterium]
MKILLTNSPISDIFIGVGNRASSSYIYLGSMLYEQKKLGLNKIPDVDVRIADVNMTGFDGFKKEIELFDPDIVGTTVYEFNWPLVGELVNAVKSVKPDVIFAVGGPTPTLIPRSIIRMVNADIVFRGEADFTFREAVKRLSKGENLEDLLDIDGVVIRKGDEIAGGSDTYPIVPQEDLENIDIDLNLFARMQEKLQYRVVDFAFSRGCPYRRCTFCQVSTTKRYGRLSLGKTIEVLKQLTSMPHIEYLIFGDGTFGGGRKGAMKLIRRMIDEDIGDKIEGFFGELSVDLFLNEGEFGIRDADIEFIKLMKSANFFGGELGIEHLSVGGLKKFDKFRYSPGEAMGVVNALANNDFEANISLINVGVDTTIEDLAEHLGNLIELYNEYENNRFVKIDFSEIVDPFIGTKEYNKILSRMLKDSAYCRATENELGKTGDLYKLPENDGYPYIFNEFIPIDPCIAGTFRDLKLYRKQFPFPAENQKEMDLFNIFSLIELMKRNTGNSEMVKKLDSIRPKSEFLIFSNIAREAVELYWSDKDETRA